LSYPERSSATTLLGRFILNLPAFPSVGAENAAV
jgi:hypothetical protein